MATTDPGLEDASTEVDSHPVRRGTISAFEHLITDKPPILESLIAQLPTESILALYHTSFHLQNFFKNSPTSWRYISWRLYQPALQTATPPNSGAGTGSRQSSNYALDQLLLYVINPFSTRLVSLELDNTAVSGATLFQTVVVLRKDTLEHISVRGCKNVSLKYHINPWLMMHAMALDRPGEGRAPGYEKLALKSLYTYRCRHHRRRPYLPSSLARKESDSEPTHELVLTCHKLGIWTDTAWCTTPGARCFRRRGYVTMRVPQDPREVWVVFDRLWRSRNWLGPVPESRPNATPPAIKKRKRRDCRSWEVDEEAMNGEPLGMRCEGKETPAHLRQTHTQFVEDIYCDNCSDPILERCEQCSVMMHCSGCRKTLCSSCAFDRPYLRNKTVSAEERNRFWWAPGCAVSPCSMQDQDVPTPGPAGNLNTNAPASILPTIKFKWCCTEPVFSGGGGITYGSGSNRDTDRIRAAPLQAGQGWEDPEFSSHSHFHQEMMTSPDVFSQIGAPLTRTDAIHGPGGRWPSIDSLFQADPMLIPESAPAHVPRILCDDCFGSEQWKIKCKACSVALCLRHDVKDRLKVRICGYKDLTVEKTDFKARQKALKLLAVLMLRRRLKGKLKAAQDNLKKSANVEFWDEYLPSSNMPPEEVSRLVEQTDAITTESGLQTPRPLRPEPAQIGLVAGSLGGLLLPRQGTASDAEVINRPLSPGSNSTGPPSRTSSPAPSARSVPQTPEPKSTHQKRQESDVSHPFWRGCQSFFCPSTRTPGDHRRRCVAIMRQCAACDIHVCETCASGLEPACPCRGCRVSNPGTNTFESPPSTDNLPFFCPNCRWSRIRTGKCKRKPGATTFSGPKTKANRRPRYRKPMEERQSRQTTAPQDGTNTSDSIDFLTEFIASIETGFHVSSRNPAQSTTDLATEVDALVGDPEEMRQLEDVGAAARDLIRRIQTLRLQFGPSSLAALALPHITMEEPELASLEAAVMEEERQSGNPAALRVSTVDGLHIVEPPTTPEA